MSTTTFWKLKGDDGSTDSGSTMEFKYGFKRINAMLNAGK